MNVYISFIQNHPKLEIIHKLISKGLDSCGTCIDREGLRHEKEGTANVRSTGALFAWKKADREEYFPYNSMYASSEQAKLRMAIQRAVPCGGGDSLKGALSGGWEHSVIVIGVMVTQVDNWPERMHFSCVHFTECKFYLSNFEKTILSNVWGRGKMFWRPVGRLLWVQARGGSGGQEGARLGIS